MSGGTHPHQPHSQPQAEAEEAALEVGEAPEETRRANVSCNHTNSRRDGRGRLL
jgi:hypothetical protein